MSNELVALNVLLASDSASEREAFKEGAARASVHVDLREVPEVGEAAPICTLLNGSNVDLVVLDSMMSRYCRKTVIDAARASAAKPLVVSIGTADPVADQIPAERLDIDGAIAKPVQSTDARTLLESCVRARLPSRVLIVDHSPTVRSVIRKVLQSSRYRFEVDEASDGQAALQKAATQRFDLVLLDCHMPGLDGFATMTMFLETHPDAKVVMVTGTGDLGLAERARGAGAHGVLSKPFYTKDVDALMGRLHGLMRQ